jgi:hypothetical protein
MVIHCRLSSERRLGRIKTKKGASGPTKTTTIKEKNDLKTEMQNIAGIQ